MSDSNLAKLRYIKNTGAYGAIPSTPTMKALRIASESFRLGTDFTQSQEIRASRGVADQIMVGRRGLGDLGIEFSSEMWDDFLLSAIMGNAYTSGGAALTPTSSTFSGSTLTAGAGTPWSTVVAGDFVLITGAAAGTPNNGLHHVVSVGGSGASIVTGTPFTTETATVTVERMDYAANGTTLDDYVIEKEYSDIASTFVAYTGACIDRHTANFPTRDVITGSFGWLAQDEADNAATLASALTAAPTNGVLSSARNFKLLEGSTYIPLAVVSASYEIRNNLYERQEVNSLDLAGIGRGQFNLSGSFEAYFSTVAQFTKYKNGTRTALAFVMLGSENHGYVIQAPAVRLIDAQRVVGGPSQQVMGRFTFASFEDPTTGVQCYVRKI